MKSVLLATSVLTVIGTNAFADETFKWRHVQHTASLQTLQVGDVNGHALNIYRLPGMAFFPDGSTGTTFVFGTSDVVNGSVPVHGDMNLKFDDGSELWTKYTGTVKVDGNHVPRKGTFTVIGGKGRYAEAQGDGTWEGDGAQVSGTDAVNYIDSVINIKK
jgi:hypothetical protein